tara:strand:+ start:21708 stop:21929 length:222 start_codon:yes stop_codon:yes gene_type:complete
MNNLECGDLIYVPSQATLFHFDSKSKNIKDYNILNKPLNLLVTQKIEEGIIGVHYKGKTWYLKQKDLYPSVYV